MFGDGGDDTFWADTDDASSEAMYGGSDRDTFHTNDDAFDYIDGEAGSDTAVDRDNPGDTVLNCETT